MSTLASKRQRQYRHHLPQKPIWWKKVNIAKEPYCYNGPAPSRIKKSLQAFLEDFIMEQSIEFTPKEIEDLINPLLLFIDNYFDQLIIKKDGHQNEVFGDMCKARSKDLIHFLNIYLSTNPDSGLKTYIFAKAAGDEMISVCSEEIKYLPKRLKGLILVDPETGEVFDQVTLKQRPGFFMYLYKYIFKLTDFYTSKGIDSFEGDACTATFLYAVTVSQLFEKTNTDTEVKQEYAEKTLAMLTGVENELPEDILELFNEVVQDLDLDNKMRRHLPYVEDIRKAYRKTRNFLSSPYEEADLYISSKSTASTIDGVGDISIIASTYEIDHLKDDPHVQAFDSLIGYDSESHYRNQPIQGYSEYKTKTVWINNPNKRKPRAIHISVNSTQDRCSYLHRRAQAFLQEIPSDCMIRHMKGVEFLLRYSARGYRLAHGNSLINFDFSDATDRLGKKFQYLVVKLFHGVEAADFWYTLSTEEKVAIMPDGSERSYIQTVGQPQGLLWSFDAFSEAHHMIMLMVMKATGRTNIPASEFYAIVGDDSAINTVTPDLDQEVVYWYKKICESVNLVVNLSKSNISTGDPMEDIIIDFAKTTVRNGRMFTPVPAGLGLAYTERKQFLGGIATNLWFDSKGQKFEIAMENTISRTFKNYTQRLMMFIALKCGKIPYLLSFKDEDFMTAVPEDLQKAILLSYYIHLIRSTLFNFCLSEKDRERYDEEQTGFQYAWDRICPEEIAEELNSWLTSAPRDCKYAILADETFSVQKALKSIYHNIGDIQSEIVASVFNNKDLSIIIELSQWLEDLNYQPVSEDEVPAFWWSLGEDDTISSIKALGSIQIPSFAGQTRQKANFFKGLIPTFKEFFSSNGYIIGLINTDNTNYQDIISMFKMIDENLISSK
jgi:hypothetical protein